MKGNATEAFLKRLTVHIYGQLWLRNALLVTSTWALGLGTLGLCLGVGFGISPYRMLWGFFLWVPAMIWAVLAARRQMPPQDSLAALLDRHGNMDGSFMGGPELWSRGWPLRSPPPVLRIRWKRNTALLRTFACLAYFVAAFWVPTSLKPQSQVDPGMAIDQQVEAIRTQLTYLKQQGWVDAEWADRRLSRLMDIQSHARGLAPAETWRALDEMQRLNREAGKQAAEQLSQLAEHHARCAAQAEALTTHPARNDLLKQINQQLALNTEWPGVASGNQPLEDALARSDISLTDLETIQQFSEKHLQELKQSLESLSRQNLASSELDRQSHRAREISREQAEKLLRACVNGRCAEPGRTLLMAMCGTGGVGRGPGDAPLILGNPSDDEGMAFQDEALPRRTPFTQDSTLLGLISGAPNASDGSEPLRLPHEEQPMTGQGSAHRMPLLPAHRSTVQRYFQGEQGGRDAE